MYDSYEAGFMSGQVAAYFDLDGTLLDSSSEKTLTAHLAKKRPWRIPIGLRVLEELIQAYPFNKKTSDSIFALCAP